jgi:opacity protein-like surface antigen
MIVLLALWIPHQGWAQSIGEQTIALATAEFEAGHFYSVPSILNDSLNNFNRDQRQRAFLLLTQIYLLLDDPIGAQRSYLEVLTANPEFIPDEQLHPIDIVYLSKRFTATPRFSWFVGGGSNVSVARVIHDLDMDGGQAEALENYYLRSGYQFGGGVEYSYDDNIRFRFEVNYLQTTYRSQTIGNSQSFFQFDEKNFIDRQTWVSLPLYVCYSDNIGTYRPYIYAGYSFSRLLGDNASIELKKVEGQGEERESFEEASPNLDFKERRNEINQSLIFGAGVKYKVGLDYVFAEARYSAGLKNIVNENNRLGNYAFDRTSGEWIVSFTPAEYAHVDDYLRLDNLSLTIGFLRPLYKPRELKRARTKGILRKMRRSK